MARRKTDRWLAGDGGPAVLPAGATNEWGGNLRLEGRPVLLRRDAQGLIEGYSTTSSTVVPAKGGGYVVIPTVIGGRDVGAADAYRHYVRTGEHWGTAATATGAEELAQAVHEKSEAANREDWNEFISGSLPALAPALREAVERSDFRAVREAAKGGRADRGYRDRRANAERFRQGWYQDARGNWVDPSKKREPVRRYVEQKPPDPNSFSGGAQNAEYDRAMAEWGKTFSGRRAQALTEMRKAYAEALANLEDAKFAQGVKPVSVLASAGMTKQEQQEYRERMRANRRQEFRADVEDRSNARMAARAAARAAKEAQAPREPRTTSRTELDKKYGNAQFPTGSGRTPAVDSATFTRKLELAKLMAERYRGTGKYQAYMDRIVKLEASGPVDKDLQAQIRRDQDYANREAMGNVGKTVYEVNTAGGRLAQGGNNPYGGGLAGSVRESVDRRTTVETLPASNLQDVIRPGQAPSGLPSVGEMAQRSMRTGAQGAWGTMLQRYQADAAARRAHKLVGQYTGGEVAYGYDAKRGRRVRDLDEPVPAGAALKAGRARRAAVFGGISGGLRTPGGHPVAGTATFTSGTVKGPHYAFSNSLGQEVAGVTPNPNVRYELDNTTGWLREAGPSPFGELASDALRGRRQYMGDYWYETPSGEAATSYKHGFEAPGWMWAGRRPAT